jgi:isochorismate synthase
VAVRDTVDRARWMRSVARLRRRMSAGDVAKVVLAREVTLRADRAFDDAAALARLREGYPNCTIFAWRRGGATFMGASPERLVRLEGRTVRTACLAGSTKRGATPMEDAELAAALLADRKERREHELVVGAVTDALAPICERVEAPREPAVAQMPNVQHLCTPVTATLRDGESALDVAQRLHPTPAVGGVPRDAALRLIGQEEPFDRGWYAGVVGWTDASEDGDFAVAIRSALVRGDEARLYAGCGIVAESDPAREHDESTMKLRPMLWSLGQQQ